MTPLALLHPAGLVTNALVVGEDAPPLLTAGLRDTHGDRPADLIVVAPGAGADDAARVLRERLAPDGLAYVISNPWTARVIARRAGLRVSEGMLHIGGRMAPSFLVPARPDVLRWAVRSLTTSARAAAASALRVPPGWMAPAAVLQRPGGRALASWFDDGDGDVVVGRSTALLVRAGSLAAVAKTGPRAHAEQAALERVGQSAHEAGAAVPRVLGSKELAEHVVIETGIEGRPAATVLARRPRELEHLLARLTDWLVRWNAATARAATLESDLLDSAVLGPARALGVPSDYGSWLERRCTELEGTSVKLVDTHNDLTTANVLWNDTAPLGIVDWESASTGFPLTDLFYAVADAHAASERFRDRAAAFRTASTAGAKWERQLVDRLGLDGRTAELAFHACWLGHAANEASRGAAERPFGEIVRMIAREGIRMSG
jgi:phosphotransferase family enzyme